MRLPRHKPQNHEGEMSPAHRSHKTDVMVQQKERTIEVMGQQEKTADAMGHRRGQQMSQARRKKGSAYAIVPAEGEDRKCHQPRVDSRCHVPEGGCRRTVWVCCVNLTKSVRE
jgi:hypothetical protein